MQKERGRLCLTKVGGEDTQIDVKEDLAARVGRSGDYQTQRKPAVSERSIKLKNIKTTTFDKISEFGDDLVDDKEEL